MSDTPQEILQEMRVRVEITRDQVYKIRSEMVWQRDVLIFIALAVAAITLKVFFW